MDTYVNIFILLIYLLLRREKKNSRKVDSIMVEMVDMEAIVMDLVKDYNHQVIQIKIIMEVDKWEVAVEVEIKNDKFRNGLVLVKSSLLIWEARENQAIKTWMDKWIMQLAQNLH